MALRVEVHLHRRLDAVLQALHVVNHAVDVLQHVAAAHAEQLMLAQAVGRGGHRPAVEGRAPVLHGHALVFANFIELMQRQARLQQRCPVVKARARAEQLGLPMVKLAGEFAAQIQVAVHHVADDAQHHVGRVARNAACTGGARITRVVAGGGQQAGGVGFAHRAVLRVHREQHPVEHRKTDGAGVDAPQHRRAALPLAVGLGVGLGLSFIGACRQAAKHQHVVMRGEVKARGQLRVEQVGDMQVQKTSAGQGLQAGLE